MLATALRVCACQQGRRVRFTTLAGLATELQEADSRKELARVVGRYSRIEVLLLDELGYLALPDGAAELVFQVISERNERGSLIVTTNLPFGEWTKVFPDPRLAKAVVDRITHKAHIIDTGTESWRFRHGLDRKKRRQGMTPRPGAAPAAIATNGLALRARPFASTAAACSPPGDQATSRPTTTDAKWGQIRPSRWGQAKSSFSPRRRPRRTQLRVWLRAHRHGRRVPRAPLPGTGVTRAGTASQAAWRGVTPSSSLIRAHAPDHPPPSASGSPSATGSLQVVASPCWKMALPDIISAILARVLGPLPRRAPRLRMSASSPRTPWSHPRIDGFDARISPHMAASVGTSISRLQSFDHLRAPALARPPGCSHRSGILAARRPGRSHHASPGRLPGPGCGVATCSTRTISMAGLSPAGSQPCRLLPTPSM